MLANLAGIVGGPVELRRARVSRAIQQMPRGGRAGQERVFEGSEVCIGWHSIVGEPNDASLDVIAVLASEDLLVAIDGRLDDCATLASELGVPVEQWATIVAEGFRRQGVAFFAMLEGDYAIVLHEKLTGRSFLVRDFAGARPIYWARTKEGGVAFASFAVAALRCAGQPFVPDHETIWREALQINLRTSSNPLHHVRLLERNHVLIVERNGAALEQEIARPCLSAPQDLIGAYRAEMLASLRCRLSNTEPPVFVTASGGLDSAAVLGAARAVLGKGFKLSAITIAPHGAPREDLAFASDVVKLNEAEWHCIETELSVLPDQAIAWHPDLFSAARSGVVWELLRAVRRLGGNSLCLGAGGDYLGGSGSNWLWWAVREQGWWRAAMLKANDSHLAPVSLVRAMVGLALRAHAPRVFRLLKRVVGEEGSEGTEAMWRLLAADEVSKRTLRREGDSAATLTRFPRVHYGEHFDFMVGLALGRELPALDAMGRIVGVEMLYPLATRRIVELARRAPLHLRRCQGKGRILLRRAAEPWLPPSVLERQGKAVYNEHFAEVWRSQLAAAPPPRGRHWHEIFSEENWLSARGSLCPASHCASFPLYVGVVCAKWIELNVSDESCN